MARQPRSAQDGAEQNAEQESPRFVLARNHGLVVGGVCRFYPAGSQFDPEKDGALISSLIRAGATFE